MYLSLPEIESERSINGFSDRFYYYDTSRYREVIVEVLFFFLGSAPVQLLDGPRYSGKDHFFR